MIGDYAVRGYLRRSTSNCCCDRTRCNQPWYGEEVSRIEGWINLLKKMEMKTTADVVAIYLIATRQSELLYSFIDEPCGSLDRNITTPSYDFNRSTQNRGVVNLNNCCSCYCGSSRKVAGDYFPLELYKMASNWLISRVALFVETISSTVSGPQGSYCSIPLNVRLPNKVINALEKFTTTATSLNNITQQVKALYATLMPTASYESSYGSNVTECRFPSLRWEAGAAGTRINERNDHNYSRITLTARNKFTDLQNILQTLANEFKMQPWHSRKDLADDVREAFCLAAEMILYIMSLSRSYSGASSMHLPKVDDANKYFFVDKVDENGHVRRDTRENPVELDRVYALSNLSPQAAICLADELVGYSLCGCNCYTAEFLTKFFAKINPKPYGEVATFLLNEWYYQKNAAAFTEHMKTEKFGKQTCCRGEVCNG